MIGMIILGVILGVVFILQIIFIVLSLTGIVNWSSSLVFLPLYIVFVIGFTYLCISSAIDSEIDRVASIQFRKQCQREMATSGETTFYR